MSDVKVKVKALEWTRNRHGITQWTKTEFGSYSIEPTRAKPTRFMWSSVIGDWMTVDTEADAKAAAQADYDRRILSALEPSPVNPGVVEALKAVLGLLGNVDHSGGGGANSARMYGGMLMDIKGIATAALASASPQPALAEAVRVMGFCGGCGETDPAKRCIGCLSDFGIAKHGGSNA